MMAKIEKPKSVDAKTVLDNYDKFSNEYIKLVQKNKQTLDERAELQRKIQKLDTKLKTHDSNLAKLVEKYDAKAFMTTERYKHLDSMVTTKKSLKPKDRKKILVDTISNMTEKEILFTTVKKILADASNTNGPNDKGVLETQTGIPASDWKKHDGKRAVYMNREKLLTHLRKE